MPTPEPISAWALGQVPCPPDGLQWLAMTVYQEAGGEPWLGKLGVAYSWVNRGRLSGAALSDVVLAPQQASAWNTASPTRLRLDDASGPRIREWAESLAAAAAALFGLAPDPTGGATHYLNVEVTREALGGRLPPWCADTADPRRLNPSLVAVMIGHHTFLKGVR